MSPKPVSHTSGDSGGDESELPSRKECHKAIKILTQYKRLAQKLRKNIGNRRLAELNRLRDAGLITISHIPGILGSEFPLGIFDNMTLNDIRNFCGM